MENQTQNPEGKKIISKKNIIQDNRLDLYKYHYGLFMFVLLFVFLTIFIMFFI